MLEQFKKWVPNIKSVTNDCDKGDCCKVSSEMTWRHCCNWVLEKAQENITLFDFMQIIADEAGIDVIIDEERETHHCYWIGYDNRCRKDNRFCVGRVVCSVYEKGEKI